MSQEQVMVRVKTAITTNIASMLNRWEDLSAGSGLDGTELTLEDIVAARVYLYDIPTSGVAGFPCVVFEDGSESCEPQGSPTSTPGYATHTFTVWVLVADSDLLTCWRKCQRTARAVADCINRYGTDGDPTVNTGIPYYCRVTEIGFDGATRDANNLMIRAAALTVVAKEKVLSTYASI